MACGLPLLTTNVGGTGEIMAEGYGKIIPPDDSEAMATATIDLANSEPTKLKEKLRQVMIERYSWEKNVDKLASIYEEII
jgi:glycosyltransferase involved in cell wall biosynthesis